MVDARKWSTYIDKVLLTWEGKKGNRQIIQQSVRSWNNDLFLKKTEDRRWKLAFYLLSWIDGGTLTAFPGASRLISDLWNRLTWLTKSKPVIVSNLGYISTTWTW